GSRSEGAGRKTSSSINDNGMGSGGSHTNKSSSPFSTNNQTNTAYPSSGGGSGGGGDGATGTASAAAAAAAARGSKIRLDIVRADAERGAGLTPRSPGRSPRPGGEGGGAAASARFDSPARELLQAYEDEQLQLAFWQEQ
ncbi:unnamed protein product, partial [Ectocarpus sp. 12 AP-2014]